MRMKVFPCNRLLLGSSLAVLFLQMPVAVFAMDAVGSSSSVSGSSKDQEYAKGMRDAIDKQFELQSFTVGQHSRMTAGELDNAGESIVNMVEYPFYDLGFDPTTLARTELYASMRLPTVPVFHPYNPAGFHDFGYGTPAFTLNVKFPQYQSSFAPPALHAHVAALPLENIDTFLSVQDMPWQNTSLLLRPQGWLDPIAPTFSILSYSKNFPVAAGLFSREDGGPVLQKVAEPPHQPNAVNQVPGQLIDESGISVHNSRTSIQGELSGDRLLVSSGDTLPVKTAAGGDLDMTKSHVIFSLTKDKQTGRAAVVKHLLLNPDDQKAFEGILREKSPRSLKELGAAVKTPGHPISPHIARELDW